MAIGDNIVITVSDIMNNSVIIGITAPADVLILREELMSECEFAEIEQRAEGGE